jgi:hypothetical protein
MKERKSMNRLLMFAFVAILTVTSLGCARGRLFGCFDREEEVYAPNACCCPTGCENGYQGAMVMPSTGTVPMIPSTIPMLPGPAGVN